ncbi:hypothetical protein JXA80_12925 [bacterium]|nr:hypothetical protein [candidate division CSSED10-310 bacterium]
MSVPVSHVYIARVVIQFRTPFHIGSGAEGTVTDAEVITDVNGLPSIPGTSLAGALRSAFGQRFGRDRENDLFGCAHLPGKTADRSTDSQDEEVDRGRGSRLTVSWGCIHDSRGVPVEGIVDVDRLNDPVLANACSPTLRDHVKIDHRGASAGDDRAKFDELVVCAGHRFTFECMMQGADRDTTGTWTSLLDVLQDASLRLGGKTRRGLGAFSVVAIDTAEFNLGTKEGLAKFSALPVRLDTPAELAPLDRNEAKRGLGRLRRLLLQPQEYWMFGGGSDEIADGGDPDMAPVRDRMIVWDDGSGSVRENALYVPGSSVKGALAHRTAYHYNRLTGFFADEVDDDAFDARVKDNPAVRELFGFALDDTGPDAKRGSRGRVLIDDIFVDSHEKITQHLVHHVAIDRFTGGARSGALFSERPIWRGPGLPITIHLVSPGAISDPDILPAFDAALADLGAARLPLGGGAGRGLGFFRMLEDTGWREWTQEGGGDA